MMTWRISLFTLIMLSSAIVLSAEPTIDELSDLTGGVIPVVSLETPDAFSGELTSLSEIPYLVRVKNQTGNPIALNSLTLVVDKILDNAGRDPGGCIEVQGHDGVTKEGKPYFRIPAGPPSELAPYAESEVVLLRIQNPDLLLLSPPSLRVYGLRRTTSTAVHDLVQTLIIQKGILSQEEAAKALEPTGLSEP